MRKLSGFEWFMVVLVLIGAINWGLVGLFRFNLVEAIFGAGPTGAGSTVSRIIYVLVGLAGIALLISLLSGERTHALKRPARTTV